MSAAVGIIANPAAGKDIRRLVAHASVFPNEEKVNIVARVLRGLAAAGVPEVRFMADPYGLCERAAEMAEAAFALTPCATPRTGGEADTTAAAGAMAEAGVACIVTLGGDGTNRAAVRGAAGVPLIAVSTGTNNVFPSMIEGTAAGLAAGALALGWVEAGEVAPRAKLLRVRGADVAESALIDVAVLEPGFAGARAIWEMERVRRVFLTRASPAATGMAALGGLLRPTSAAAAHGLDIVLGPGGPCVRAPVAPGLIVPVPVARFAELAPGRPVCVPGPCLLAFDGERGLPVPAGAAVTVTLAQDGPPVVDVERSLLLAVERGFLRGE